MTHRTFHPGALVRSATEGGQASLLTVKRTDMMRVIVLVPDRDVVLTSVGDPAVVSVDALGGQIFTGTVARIAESEDPTTRTMRVEIDLPNPKGLLRDGMYGKATIALEPVSRNLTVPPACVVEHSGRPTGSSTSSATGSPAAPRSSWAATTAPWSRSSRGSSRTIPSSSARARRWRTGWPSSQRPSPAGDHRRSTH